MPNSRVCSSIVFSGVNVVTSRPYSSITRSRVCKVSGNMTSVSINSTFISTGIVANMLQITVPVRCIAEIDAARSPKTSLTQRISSCGVRCSNVPFRLTRSACDKRAIGLARGLATTLLPTLVLLAGFGRVNQGHTQIVMRHQTKSAQEKRPGGPRPLDLQLPLLCYLAASHHQRPSGNCGARPLDAN